MENQLTLVPSEELPVTDAPKKVKPRTNCLGEVLRAFMDKHKLKDADVVKATGISWSTFHGWITEDVFCQLADQNLFKLWMFLNKYEPISLEALVYGIGADFDEDQPA